MCCRGPVGPDACLTALESGEHLVLDHADLVGQHDADLDTAESLEYTVVENILDGRPMEGVTCPELLEYSLRLLDATLDGGLVERISECNSVGPVGLPQHAEKTLEPLEHMVLTQTDLAGQFDAVGTLSPSDCYPVGPVGPYVTGGPAGPDVYITDPN